MRAEPIENLERRSSCWNRNCWAVYEIYPGWNPQLFSESADAGARTVSAGFAGPNGTACRRTGCVAARLLRRDRQRSRRSQRKSGIRPSAVRSQSLHAVRVDFPAKYCRKCCCGGAGAALGDDGAWGLLGFGFLPGRCRGIRLVLPQGVFDHRCRGHAVRLCRARCNHDAAVDRMESRMDASMAPDAAEAEIWGGLRRGDVYSRAGGKAGAMQGPMEDPSDASQVSNSSSSAVPLRIRQWFPETLLWRPELITDDQGEVSLDVELADSITTWRLTTGVTGRRATGRCRSIRSGSSSRSSSI